MRAVGVGSGVTGFGANLFIIDDPIKSRAEAESAAYRDRVYEWFNDDIYTRLEPDGAVILIQATRSQGEPVGQIAWRGMLFILVAPILFGLTVRGLGFVGAVFITSLFAAFASFKMKPLYALVLAALLTVFSTAVFSYGLGLPFERVGPWLRW